MKLQSTRNDLELRRTFEIFAGLVQRDRWISCTLKLKLSRVNSYGTHAMQWRRPGGKITVNSLHIAIFKHLLLAKARYTGKIILVKFLHQRVLFF